MRQRDNEIGAVVSVFVCGAVRDRDSRGGERLASEREKGVLAFLQFSEMEEGGERVAGFGIFRG